MAAKYVAIVAMGASRNDFVAMRLASNGPSVVKNEVWTINAAADVIRSDLIFMMDPMWDQEIGQRVYRAAQHSNTTIMTSKADRRFPLLKEFPLEDVVKKLGGVYFNTTVAYALAYALYNDYTDIGLYGCDFTYPDRHWGEAGRGCVEFWAGRASAVGVNIHLPPSTQLMDSAFRQPLYGYWTGDGPPPDDQYGVGMLRYDEYLAMKHGTEAPAPPAPVPAEVTPDAPGPIPHIPLRPRRTLPPVQDDRTPLKLVSGEGA